MTRLSDEIDAEIAAHGGNVRDALNIVMAQRDAAMARAAAAEAETTAIGHCGHPRRYEWQEYENAPIICAACAVIGRRRYSDRLEDEARISRAALERARAVLAEIESEAREKIIAPDTDAAQMVVSDAIAEVSARIAAALGRDGAR